MEYPSAAPFIVRAHHIEKLVLSDEGRPADVAEVTVWAMGKLSSSTAVDSEGEVPAYVMDVVGSSPDQAQAFHDGIVDTVTKFQQLPNDAPVRLVAGIKDGICNGCAIGNHCAKPENAEIDLKYLDELGQIAVAIECMDRIKVGHDKNKPHLKYFDTNADTLRALVWCYRNGYDG